MVSRLITLLMNSKLENQSEIIEQWGIYKFWEGQSDFLHIFKL